MAHKVTTTLHYTKGDHTCKTRQQQRAPESQNKTVKLKGKENKMPKLVLRVQTHKITEIRPELTVSELKTMRFLKRVAAKTGKIVDP